jgi:hypothetical protein
MGSLLWAAGKCGECQGDDDDNQGNEEEHSSSSQVVHSKHQFVHSGCCLVGFLNGRQRATQNVAGQPEPADFVPLGMEFELNGGPFGARKNPEEVERLKFDPFQIALMRSSHTSSTVEQVKTGL